MAKVYTCKFNVSRAQLEKIRQEAQAQGYVRLAPYFRDLALQRNRFVETKVIETHEMVKRILEEKDGRE